MSGHGARLVRDGGEFHFIDTGFRELQEGENVNTTSPGQEGPPADNITPA
ncbi:hypothetical protein [Streptomyces sp. NPDC020597]